jgi:hypothetical protein
VVNEILTAAFEDELEKIASKRSLFNLRRPLTRFIVSPGGTASVAPNPNTIRGLRGANYKNKFLQESAKVKAKRSFGIPPTPKY